MEITLRDWRIGDENDLINLYDKYDRTYCDIDYPMPGTCDREKANFHITNFPLIRKFGGDVQAIVLDGKIVGLIKYRKLIDHCVLEIILLPEICGRGVGSKAVRQMMRQTFADDDIDVMYAFIYETNAAAIHMAEKVGMINCGADDTSTDTLHGKPCAKLIYGIARPQEKKEFYWTQVLLGKRCGNM